MWRYGELRAAGLSRGAVRHRVEAGRIGRLSRGVYGYADDEMARLRALFRRLPPGTVAGFHTGARLHRFAAAPADRVHVIVPAGSAAPRIRGVAVHQSVLPVDDVVVVAGVPCAPAARCAVDLARVLRRADALPVLDLCLRVGACRRADLRAELRSHAGLRGVRQAGRLAELADPRAECRQESQLRLLLVDAGLPVPEPQLWVPDDDGVPLYRLDLGYRRERIGVEYDGRSHLDPDRLHHDRSRLNWLAEHGWRLRVYTATDLYRRPKHIQASIRALLTAG
ncbi:type IV toxin-antitoxin system AbiEi family antitoxin domain-containing protein [Micromonospora sp. NBS 11-29]|uniref:type IV toxin-antitoxin system AbiEi family antitoxin domain-containing protein n=1 Tax=Micromonospora sp. NBS 11-29 TaxID=1960879 RepID=UPI000B797ECA|nr:type IV toxin-antitoxin system AbiEi family antitoxin domain-containing protein [Micromonospora sp. NBS 11-29]